MATTLTINYSINGVEKNLLLTEVNRFSEDFRENYVSLNIGCLDEIENSVLSELMRSVVSKIIYIEESESHEFINYNSIIAITRSYQGEGSMLSFTLRNYFN